MCSTNFLCCRVCSCLQAPPTCSTPFLRCRVRSFGQSFFVLCFFCVLARPSGRGRCVGEGIYLFTLPADFGLRSFRCSEGGGAAGAEIFFPPFHEHVTRRGGASFWREGPSFLNYGHPGRLRCLVTNLGPVEAGSSLYFADG